tara:strand:+ start:2671 stop:4137 length:1467 start_codon:yes stop_codon:yes gene_type:complete
MNKEINEALKLPIQGDLFTSQNIIADNSSEKAAEIANKVASATPPSTLPSNCSSNPDTILKKRERVSNIKLRYVAEKGNKKLMEEFSDDLMRRVRLTSKIIGKKCDSGIVHKICNQSGYIWTPEEEKITPTFMRDDPSWLLEVWKDCDNKGLPTILIEQVLNRYQSYKKRNKKWPKYVEFKKCAINIKKNYLRYCDKENVVWLRDFKNNKIKLKICDERSVLVHKGIWIKKLEDKKKPSAALTTVAWAANVIFHQKQIIPIVKITESEAYRPVGDKFFAVDINKSDKDWLTFNMPINGHWVYPKPDHVKNAEKRVAAVEDAINKSLKIKPHQRRGQTVEVKHPEFEGKVFKCISEGRRRLRLYWKDAHKKLLKEVRNCSGLDQIMKFVLDNKLGYAHDDLASGQKNGTFSQDKLKIEWIRRTLENGIPFELVNPAYTSQRCPECGHESAKNRKKDEFKCVNCDYENESHKVGALNIAEKARKAYSVRK